MISTLIVSYFTKAETHLFTINHSVIWQQHIYCYCTNTHDYNDNEHAISSCYIKNMYSIQFKNSVHHNSNTLIISSPLFPKTAPNEGQVLVAKRETKETTQATFLKDTIVMLY